MRIVRGTYAVFWRQPGGRVQFHADVGAGSPTEAAKVFRELFPGDVIASVRGSDGRFSGFTEGATA